jgi:hypothetical protein
MVSRWLSWLDFLQPKVREFADTFMESRSQLNQNLVRWLPAPEHAPLTLILVHFPATFERLQQALDHARVPYRIHLGSISPEEVDRLYFAQPQTRSRTSRLEPLDDQIPLSTGVYLAFVEQLQFASLEKKPSNRTTGPSSADPSPARRVAAKVGVLVAERHHRRAEDDRVRKFCGQISARSQIGFFVAFDDPLLAGHVDPALYQMLEHYGMKKDEPLQSGLLERLVRRRQKRGTT